MKNKIPKRYFINPETGEQYERNYNWVNMENKTREQILKGIKSEFYAMKTLDFDNINDLIEQLDSITFANSGDREKEALRFVIERAQDEMRRVKNQKSESKKLDIMQSVLSDIKLDLDRHIDYYFGK